VLGALLWLAAGAAAQADPPAKTLPPVRITSQQAKKLLVEAVSPKYPALARVNYIQGHVQVELLISPEGRVEQAHVLKGHPFLAAAALTTISEWRFRSYKVAHQARRVLAVVDLNFALHTRELTDLPLTPEADLKKQISPPRLAETPPPSDETVRMRVLVGRDGNALDSLPEAGGNPAELEAARRTLKHLKFLPAYWGALAVPWYLDVQVPVEDPPDVSARNTSMR
jgi:TonB family protein